MDDYLLQLAKAYIDAGYSDAYTESVMYAKLTHKYSLSQIKEAVNQAVKTKKLKP